MNFDRVIGGVGSQSVLSIAWVLDHAANEAGLYLKQSEVHGMAQRGGAVSAFVRLSDQPVACVVIAEGCADMVLSVEPLESLRYTKLLKPEGWIVSDIAPMINIAGEADQCAVCQQSERVVKAYINAIRIGDSASRFAAALVATASTRRIWPRWCHAAISRRIRWHQRCSMRGPLVCWRQTPPSSRAACLAGVTWWRLTRLPLRWNKCLNEAAVTQPPPFFEYPT